MRRTGRTCSHVPVRLTGAALPAASDPSLSVRLTGAALPAASDPSLSARLKRDGAFRPLTPEMGLFT